MRAVKIRLIGRIGRICPILLEPPRDTAHRGGFSAIGIPKRQPAVAKEILVVQQQFFQAGTGDVDQPQLGLR